MSKSLPMDSWILVVLGSGGVGKTALAVQVCPLSRLTFLSSFLIFAVCFETLPW